MSVQVGKRAREREREKKERKKSLVTRCWPVGRNESMIQKLIHLTEANAHTLAKTKWRCILAPRLTKGKAFLSCFRHVLFARFVSDKSINSAAELHNGGNNLLRSTGAILNLDTKFKPVCVLACGACRASRGGRFRRVSARLNEVGGQVERII